MARRTSPPEGLSDRGRQLWASCLARDPGLTDATNPQRAVLHEACRTADRLDSLAAILDRDGPITTDSKGDQAPHAALKVSLAAEALLARLIASLRMPDAAGKRPQKRGAPRLQTLTPRAGTVSSLERARRCCGSLPPQPIRRRIIVSTTTETTPAGAQDYAPETSTNVDTDITVTPTQEAPETPVNAPVDDVHGDQDQDQDNDVNEALVAVTAERDALVLQVARLTVAAEFDVPADLLRGDDEDELREHAQALTTFAGSRAPADFGAGNRGASPLRDTDPLRTALRR